MCALDIYLLKIIIQKSMNQDEIISNPDSPEYQIVKNYTEKLYIVYQRLTQLPNSVNNAFLVQAVEEANARVKQSIYIDNKNSNDELLQLRQELLQKDNKEVNDYLLIGNLSLYLYDYFTSFNAYSCCLSQVSTFNYGQIYLIALTLIHYESYLSALPLLSSIVQHLKPPFLQDAHFRLGILYAQQLDYKKAIFELQSFVPDSIPWVSAQDVILLISQTSYLMNDLTSAIRRIETCTTITPAILQHICFLYLLSNQTRKFESGISLLNNHVATKHSPYLLYLRSRLYHKKGQINEAFESMKTAISMKDDEPLFWLAMGNIYFITQQFKEAAGCYHQSMVLDETMAEAWINYGATLEFDPSIGDPMAFYQRAIAELKIPERQNLVKRKNLIESLGKPAIIPQIMEPNDKKLFKNVSETLVTIYSSENPIFTVEQIKNPLLLIASEEENQQEVRIEFKLDLPKDEEEEEEEDNQNQENSQGENLDE